MAKKPVILIAPEDVNDAFGTVFVMNKEYADGIRAAGGLPLGAGDYRAAEAYVEFADALVIPGGPDMHVARYGKYFMDFMEIATFSNTRDDFDFALCDAFLKAGKPILGIGRGAQVVNVALGGTLVRDIKPRLTAANELTDNSGNCFAIVNGTPGGFSHRYGTHSVTVEKDSRLAGVLGEKAVVNSFHHQAVEELGEGLRAVAFSEDGVIEAFEHTSRPVMGVQWHPEHRCEGYEPDTAVFETFIAMVKEGK